MKRPLLILDLDETLLWASEDQPEKGYDFRAFPYFVTKRPHLDVFLEAVLAWFDLAVWTSSGEDYAKATVSKLFEDPSSLNFVWASSRCTQAYDQDTLEAYALKDLKKVKRKGYPLERVLLIDDSPEKARRQYGNHLHLRPFQGDPHDRELLDVLPFLDWIRNQDDFRKIEKRNWRARRLPSQ